MTQVLRWMGFRFGREGGRRAQTEVTRNSTFSFQSGETSASNQDIDLLRLGGDAVLEVVGEAVLDVSCARGNFKSIPVPAEGASLRPRAGGLVAVGAGFLTNGRLNWGRMRPRRFPVTETLSSSESSLELEELSSSLSSSLELELASESLEEPVSLSLVSPRLWSRAGERDGESTS